MIVAFSVAPSGGSSSDSVHDAVAARLAAGLPLAIVDGEGMLEIAERAVGLDVVAQRRPAGGGGLLRALLPIAGAVAVGALLSGGRDDDDEARNPTQDRNPDNTSDQPDPRKPR